MPDYPPPLEILVTYTLYQKYKRLGKGVNYDTA